MAELLQWQDELKKRIRHPAELLSLGVITEADFPIISEIHKEFAFAITPYYANLIDWTNINDPLLKIVLPSIEEADMLGALDVGEEHTNIVNDGVQQKYPSTLLILPFHACFSYCRFCFRKRLFIPDFRGDEVLKDLAQAIEYIKTNPSINNILITGGDPLMMKTDVIRQFLSELRAIENVKIVRFGSRALSFLPSRFTSDPALVACLQEFSKTDKRVYIVNHLSHPKELTNEVQLAADLLLKAGVILVNQFALLRGINDNPNIIRELLNKLAECGIAPYYIFQFKFIKGGNHFRVPIYKAIDIFNEATTGLNGLAKRTRLIMAHATGKIELLGYTVESGNRTLYYKYHQARNESLIGRIQTTPIDDDTYWLDNLH